MRQFPEEKVVGKDAASVSRLVSGESGFFSFLCWIRQGSIGHGPASPETFLSQQEPPADATPVA